MLDNTVVSGFKWAVVEMGSRPLILEIKNVEVFGPALVIYDTQGQKTFAHISRVTLLDRMP